MFAGAFIIGISLVLFVYWLRYSCVLLLRAAQERTAASQASDERFSVASVMEQLKGEGELAPLERELERDYQMVTYLIEHAADLQLASIENRLLILDYRMMRVWSRVTRTLAPEQSRRALNEMASVLNVLVQQIGEPGGLELEA